MESDYLKGTCENVVYHFHGTIQIIITSYLRSVYTWFLVINNLNLSFDWFDTKSYVSCQNRGFLGRGTQLDYFQLTSMCIMWNACVYTCIHVKYHCYILESCQVVSSTPTDICLFQILSDSPVENSLFSHGKFKLFPKL